MSVDIKAYTAPSGDPVLVHVVAGAHDISRHVAVHAQGRCEDQGHVQTMTRALRRHGAGRAAMRLLARHGGPDWTLAEELPEARTMLAEYVRDVEYRFVEAVNAVLCHPDGHGPDVDRWRGQAEAYRTVAEALCKAAGIKAPPYRERVWRDAHGVYTPEYIEKLTAGRIGSRLERACRGVMDSDACVWMEDDDGTWTSSGSMHDRVQSLEEIEALAGPCHWVTIGSATSGEEDPDD